MSAEEKNEFDFSYEDFPASERLVAYCPECGKKTDHVVLQNRDLEAVFINCVKCNNVQQVPLEE
ncbi:hypothetical protein [Endozoicomonas lisbonensis]|uniref:hypothetical protein n=1 Tax=Endozoicomonas lisbonensis TaxID=3120522 RepID=UPI003394A721